MQSNVSKRERLYMLSLLRKHNTFTAQGKVRTIWRLVWLAVVLGATIGCLITITDRIKYLISDQLSTTISVTKEHALTFPAVTVCNLNIWRADSFDETILGLIREQVNQNISESNYDLNCDALESIFTNIPTYEELSVKTRYRVEDLITRCEFATNDCGNLTEVFEPVLTNLGICYTFNSGKVKPPLQSVGAGERHGLLLEVNVDQKQYLTADDAGVKIAVHTQSEPPLPDDYGIAVPTGKKAFVRVKQLNTNDQTHSKKHCRSNDDLSTFNFLRGEFDTYSEAACLVDCQYTSIADNCACVGARSFYSPDTADYSKLPNCTLKSMCCIDDEFLSPKNCTCPVVCSSVSYETSVSYSTYPAEYISDYIDSTDFLRVSVYFETLNVETYTTYHAYSFIALLSDIGGQSGLFLGLSVISILEFGDWIIKKIKSRDLRADMNKVKNKCSLCCQTHSVALDENSYNLVDSETST